MKKTIHFRDHGYLPYNYKTNENLDVILYRPLCSPKWTPKTEIAHRWDKVTCKKCLKKKGES